MRKSDDMRASCPGTDSRERGDASAPLDLAELLQLCQGQGQDGLPASSLALALYTKTGEEEEPGEETVLFGSTDNHFFLWRHTLVAEVLFDPRFAAPLGPITRLLEDWIPNLQREDYRCSHQLHLLITPMAGPGELTLDLCEVMYASLWQERSSHRWHLVLVCSVLPGDGSVLLLEGEDLDLPALRREARSAWERETEELEQEYESLRTRADAHRAGTAPERVARLPRFRPEAEPEETPRQSPDGPTPWMRFVPEENREGAP